MLLWTLATIWTYNMKKLPQRIIRLDDGAVFVLDEKLQTYSLESANNDKKKGHLVWEYTYERLMEDPRNKGSFKVAEGTEDLAAMRKRWLSNFKRIYE